jgi:hypothetical protein
MKSQKHEVNFLKSALRRLMFAPREFKATPRDRWERGTANGPGQQMEISETKFRRLRKVRNKMAAESRRRNR